MIPELPDDLRLGKRDPLNKRAIPFSNIAAPTLPAYPSEVDHLDIGGWEMLGNDLYGDCVAVTWANQRRLLSRLSGDESYPDLDAVLTLYRSQNPGFPSQDDGMDIQTCLELLTKAGGPDGVKAVAFAKVDHHDEAEVKAALAIFGCLWVGVQVQEANMRLDMPNGVPWEYHQGSSLIGGHSIIVGGYDSDHVGGDETTVTWGQHTSFTDAFWGQLVDEAWVVIWPEHLTDRSFLAGVDTAALGSAFFALTGRTLDLPVVEEPVVDPADLAVDQLLAQALKPWLPTISSTTTVAGRLAVTARDWLTQKSL